MNLDPVRLTGSVHLGGQSLPNIVWESAIGDIPTMGCEAPFRGLGQPEGELDSRKSPPEVGGFVSHARRSRTSSGSLGASTVSFRS